MNSTEQKQTTIYMAPLQGFTDVVYRKAYNTVFSGVDAYFIPYISVRNNQVIKKYEKEILNVNNPQKRVVPQVLANNKDELLFLTDFLMQQEYSEINLNLGCPYPMVTNRGQGAGLLPFPDKIREMLEAFFTNFDIQLSIKMRAGLDSTLEIEDVIPVLNDFPLREIIVHPRIAKQLYSGTVSTNAFEFAAQNTHHKLVYNGDVFSVAGFERIKNHFPTIQHFMLGRGILQNPFLPLEIRNNHYSETEKTQKLVAFHHCVLENYLEWMDNEGNALNKMKQFWIYFENSFGQPKKLMKQIKKVRSLNDYKTITNIFFRDLI